MTDVFLLSSVSVSDFVLQKKMTRKSHNRRVLTPLCTEIKVGDMLLVSPT